MPFTSENPHINAAIVMGGMFSQFADPLDWLARGFEINTKVERGQLMESLANRGGAGMPIAEARGTDKFTRFRIEVVGKCEQKMVAQCRFSFNQKAMTRKFLEEHAVDLTLVHSQSVLGIQITRGKQEGMEPGVQREKEDTYIRLYPLNVFSRAFFKDQIAAMQKDKNVKVVDVGDAVIVELLHPWLFYDMGTPRKKMPRVDNLLPFNRV